MQKQATYKVLDYYSFGSAMSSRSFTGASGYKFGYQGSEKDFDVNQGAYTTHFRMLDTRLGRWWSTDPVKHPHQSSYTSMDNNPIWFNDVFGDDIDKNSSGYSDAKKRATPEYKKNNKNQIIYKKDGVTPKKQINRLYEPEFEKIFKEFENNPDILVRFEHLSEGSDIGGTISYDGKTKDGSQKIYSAKWNPSLTNELGTSGVFEESYHLKEALEGKHLSFTNIPGGGTLGLDIYDEVRAKQWVGDNIRIRQTKSLVGRYSAYTHYGYVKILSNKEEIKDNLMNGTKFLEPISQLEGGTNQSYGTTEPPPYKVFGFGGKRYSKMSPTQRYPPTK